MALIQLLTKCVREPGAGERERVAAINLLVAGAQRLLAGKVRRRSGEYIYVANGADEETMMGTAE
jgi:hypothetical protein